MRKTLQATLVALLFIAANLSAQDAVINAFKDSYTLETKGDYNGAVNTLKKVYDASSYELNLRIGWLLYSAGSFSEAATYYQKSIELRPMSIEAKLGFALPASALGNWEQVLTQYENILKIDGQNTLVNYRAGMIYYGRKDYKTAEKYFEKVVNLYPFDYNSLLMLGWTKLFLGKSQEAKVLFIKVLYYSPDDPSAKDGLNQIK